MWPVFVAIGLGAGLGYALRERPGVAVAADRLSGGAVFVLLFLLGLAVGRNALVMANLGQIGRVAIGFSVSAMVGSILAVRLFVGRHDAE